MLIVLLAFGMMVWGFATVWNLTHRYTFPSTSDLSITTERVEVVYQSPEFGTCIPGQCCDICDGRRKSGLIYTPKEARKIAERIVASDSLASVVVRRAE